MVLKHAPAALNRVVFAVVAWVVRQAQRYSGALDKLDHVRHELGPPAVALGAVVEVEHQRIDAGKVLALVGPELLQAIGEAVAGNLAGDREEVQRRPAASQTKCSLN